MTAPTPVKKSLSTKQLITLAALSMAVLVSCTVWIGWQKMSRSQNALQLKIAALQEQITTLENQQPPALPASVEATLSALKNDVAALHNRPVPENTTQIIQQRTANNPLLASISLQLLQQQIRTGQGFQRAYTNTKAALASLGITTTTPTLEATAQNGIATTAQLLESFNTIVKKPVMLTQEHTSWLGKTLASLVQVKKVYAADNDAIAQTQEALRQEQIQRAISAVERLPQELQRQRELQEWQENLEKRQQVAEELDALEKQIEDLAKQQQAHPLPTTPAPSHD
jgi:hypothetical protein